MKLAEAPPVVFSTSRSKAVSLLQFFFCLFVGDFKFGACLSLFVPHLAFF